ncbi:MAG: transposase [Oscillospiraceae bacterium]|nr:transposase [Oscillospiraceae bacterium]
MRELPTRKCLRLSGFNYASAGHYYVTICVKDKHEVLGKIVGATRDGRPRVCLSDIGQIVDGALIYYNENHPSIKIDNYVIMPNHIHAIVAIQNGTGDRGRSPLQYIVRNLKSFVTKQIGYSIWQKSFHDRIIRNQEKYQRIWQYIDENPANWEEDDYFIM